MQKHYIIFILVFNLMTSAICQLSKRRGISRRTEEEIFESPKRPSLRNTGRMKVQRNLTPRRHNFTFITKNRQNSESFEDFVDITAIKATSPFVEVPLFENPDVVTQIPKPIPKKPKRRRPRPRPQPPPPIPQVVHQIQPARIPKPMNRAIPFPRQPNIKLPPPTISQRIRTTTPTPIPTRLAKFSRFRQTFTRPPSFLITTTLPPMPQPVFRRTRGKRIRTTTPATTALTRRPTLPRTMMTRLPKFRPSIPIRTFPTRFLAFTTPTPFTSSFLPETRSRHTQTPSTLPFLPETRSRHTQMELKSQTKRVDNSRELNTVGTEPLSSTSKTPKTTFSSTSGPEPPPSSISPSSSEIQNSNSKGPAQPPGFIPPNDAVVDKLNNAIDFMAIAKRMRLRRRRLSFIRRFAAQTRSKAAVS